MKVGVIASSTTLLAIVMIYSWGCSASSEPIGQSTSALSAGTNYFLSGSSLYGAHEVALAAGGNIDRPLWAAVFDPHDCGVFPYNQGLCFNWAYSSDGQYWTAAQLLFQSQIAPPPPDPMSDNGTFAGWSGDPSLAAIHGPLSNNGRRMVVTNIAASSTGAQKEDVVIAVSNTDGASWGYPRIVSSPPPHGAGGGGNVDSPVVAAHTNDPYSIYVGWTNNFFAAVGFISNVSYDLSYNFSAQPAIPIPPAGSGSQELKHLALDIGRVTECDGQTHEAVYVAWVDHGDRCTGGGTPETISQIGWWLDVYDTVTGLWAPTGPWQVESDTDWPLCVGKPLPSGGAQYGDNSPFTHIAVDPIGSSFSIVHTENSIEYGVFGSQTHVISGSVDCSSGTLRPTFTGGGPAYPTPQCYRPATGCPPNPDGTPGPNGLCGGPPPTPCFVRNDQWGPTVSFARRGSTPQTLVTWYDTRGDQNNNNLAAVWGMWSNNFGNTWSAPFPVSTPTSHWNETWSWWWDYQGLAAGPNGKFMAAWGGDARLGNGADGVWSTLIQ